MPSNTLTAPVVGPVAPTSNVYSASNNRNVYSSYDAAGNLTAFGAIGLSYDAENRQTAAGTNSYLYDGAGQCVSKTTGAGQTTFVYDAFGQLAAEYAGGTVWKKDYVRAGGQIAAIENASGAPCTTCYLSYDFLGSVRMVTDQSANVIARQDYAPFGQEIQAGVGPRTSLWGASDNVNQKFTGQERDGETNLDFFQARYLSSGLGRFMRSDPGNAGADPTNPQSWNGYAYVLNNPLTMIDPSGTDPGDGDGCDDGDDWCDGYPWPTGTGGPVSPPPPPPTQTESGGGNTLPRGSFPGGETLGLPPGIGVPSVLQVLLGGGSGAPCDFGACNGIIQAAGGIGNPITDPEQFLNNALLQMALNRLRQSPSMRAVMRYLDDPSRVVTVKFNNNFVNKAPTAPYFPAVINWDPHAALACPGNAGFGSPILALAEELAHNYNPIGHLATGPNDDTEEQRVRDLFVNPLAQSLGFCTKSDHSGDLGSYIHVP